MRAASSGPEQTNARRRRKWPWIATLLVLLLVLLNYHYQFYPRQWGGTTPKEKASSINSVSDVSEPAEATPPAPEKKIKPEPATKKPAGKEGESEATRVIDYAQIKKDTPKNPEEIEAPSKPAVRVKAETIEDQEQAAEEIGPADLQPEQAENTVPPLNEQATEKPLRKNVAEAKAVKPAGKPVEKPAPAAEKQEKPDQIPDQSAAKENKNPATIFGIFILPSCVNISAPGIFLYRRMPTNLSNHRVPE